MVEAWRCDSKGAHEGGTGVAADGCFHGFVAVARESITTNAPARTLLRYRPVTRRATPRSVVDATDLVSPELLGQLKVRRVLVQRALERLFAGQPPSSELRAMVELFEAYDGSVAALLDLLSLDTPSGVVESRQRQSSPSEPTRARGRGPTR